MRPALPALGLLILTLISWNATLAQEEEPEDVGTPEESLEQEEGGFPWGIAFAVVAIGALLALIVRARQQSTGGERRNDQNDQDDRQDEANNDGPEDRED